MCPEFWVHITCKDVFFCYFIGRQPYSEGSLSRAAHGVCHYFTGDFHLLSHSIFLIWPHFYDKSLEKYICLIFLPHFTTTAYGLHHSRYGFWQIHFRFLINMIIDIHCDLCIWMVFAPLRSVLNGCPPDIQHPITYCITLGLTLFSPNLVHPVWRRVCGCVKYRTKKFYFFLPKTIWRSNFVLTYPPGPPPTIIIS